MTPELRKALRVAILTTVRTEPGTTHADIDHLIDVEVESVIEDLAQDGAIAIDGDDVLHVDESEDRCTTCGRYIDQCISRDGIACS